MKLTTTEALCAPCPIMPPTGLLGPALFQLQYQRAMAGAQRPLKLTVVADRGSLFSQARVERILTIALLPVPGLLLLFMTARWPDTPDGLLHLQRVRALAQALAGGVLYPRWFADFSFGYGYPVLNFYSPAFYYPPALLHLAGFDLLVAVRLTLAGAYAFSGWACYRLLRNWTPPAPAGVATALFLFFPYRYYDLFIRGALPEFVAFLWLPLIGHFTFCAWRECEDSGVGRQPLLLAALAWAGLTLTHNLTALMAALTLICLLPLTIIFSPAPARRLQWRRCGRALLALLLGIGLSAWYVLPALLEARWVGLGVAGSADAAVAHLARGWQLFSWALFYPYPSADQPTVQLPAYILLLALLGLGFLLQRSTRQRAQVAIALTLTLAIVWLTSGASAPLWRLAAPVLGRLQFPWRWQTVLSLTSSLLLAALLLWPRRSPPTRPAAAWPRLVLLAALSVYLALYALARLDYPDAAQAAGDVTVEAMWAWDAEHGQIGASWTGEFLPIWVEEQRWAIGRAPSDGSQARGDVGDLKLTPQRIGYLHTAYTTASSRSQRIILSLFYYPAWTASVDGRRVEAEPVTNLGLLSIEVPAGEHQIDVRWTSTRAVRFGTLIALATWSGAALLLWRRRRAHGPLLMAWGLLGLLAIVAATAPLQRVRTPTPTGADFGPVQLMGSSVDPAGVGASVRVQLHWLITAPDGALTSFIHVVDPSGNIVAQQDGPLGGVYVPAERWQPGRILANTHHLPLPAGLPAGPYAVLVGLYRPGAADTPLATDDGTTRVRIGELEVAQ